VKTNTHTDYANISQRVFPRREPKWEEISANITQHPHDPRKPEEIFAYLRSEIWWQLEKKISEGCQITVRFISQKKVSLGVHGPVYEVRAKVCGIEKDEPIVEPPDWRPDHMTPEDYYS
jgi:hypothetical protein